MAKKNQQGVIDVNETLNKSEAFFNKNKKTIIISMVALMAIIAGIFLYQAYVSGPREEKASTALGKGQEYFMAEQFDKALNGDGAGYAGLCYANLDKWNEAIKYLDEYSPANDAMVSPAALAALGNAYAHTNQLDKAVSSLESAADKADKQGKDGINNSLSPTFRLQAALILESQGKKDEALKMYEEIKKKYTTSSLVQSQEIDKYIQRLSAK